MGGRGHFEAQKLTFTRRKIDAVNRGVLGSVVARAWRIYMRGPLINSPIFFLSAIAANAAYFPLEIG